VIRNAQHALSIVGSANFTNNPRIEAGTVCNSNVIADFHQKWILEVLQNAHPFRNGVK
jgi:hypothetical protein